MRRAVERTVHTTLGSAGLTRDRAQEVVDEVVNRGQQTAARAGRGVRDARHRQAEAAASVSDRLREALRDLGDLRSTIERLANQVEALESRVSTATGLRRKKATATKRSASAKKAGAAKKRATKKRASSAKSTTKKNTKKAAKKPAKKAARKTPKKAAKRSSTKARTRAAPRRSSRSASR